MLAPLVETALALSERTGFTGRAAPARRDSVRDLWLGQPPLVAAELGISPREAEIVGTLQPR